MPRFDQRQHLTRPHARFAQDGPRQAERLRHGDNIETSGALLSTVAQEVAARRQARADGVRSVAPLHLVIDKAQDVLTALEADGNRCRKG